MGSVGKGSCNGGCGLPCSTAEYVGNGSCNGNAGRALFNEGDVDDGSCNATFIACCNIGSVGKAVM